MDEVGLALPKNASYKGDALFLGGENSDYIEPMDNTLIKNHFPKAIIETVANAGHWLHAENPDDFFDYCTEFLK